ncbi:MULTISPECIES: hypothetical protein [Providencia]|jgi:hypothetical protein|uniref:Uncharacterized protein n=1 Tax=Providencia alcalifaciens TaxID=126385 RepID=A0A4R3NTF7_9GAMM|nr:MULTISPECIES: hypothetical protein [Providencia]ETS99836.1 hypothetical protein HMPREF1568_0257 [Providencia alcalifaciens PAL-3]EUD00934.1 hypothetical protein HMPREF1566_2846 [Providencia alcalifaciens PAL-1]MBC5790917.1 hypothetical protein [Providencia sp. JUb39]MBG5882532.1 hypothetical protein [Providencia alcalifaciens]MBS0923949.1 hypothetical protein [Providencia sp. JGM181]
MAGHMVLIGWALWVSPCGTDSCDALPVTETIFTQEQCMSRKSYLEAKRPNLFFLCGEVYRDSDEIAKEEKSVVPAPNPPLPVRNLPERKSR